MNDSILLRGGCYKSSFTTWPNYDAALWYKSYHGTVKDSLRLII